MAVIAVTCTKAVAESDSLDDLAAAVEADCVAAGEPARSCACMVAGLIDRLSTADARRFFLLRLDRPAGDLPMLSLEEVDGLYQRAYATMQVLGPECGG